MTLHVDPDDLRRAARRARRAAEPLASYDFEPRDVKDTTFGHVELAAWFLAVADQCDKAGRALYDGATDMADTLDLRASDYETTDQQEAGRYRPPFAWPPAGLVP